ncbi:hypothetical protein HHK36_002654 [Tetracentron sinense]|uniref:DYW domain-containing protein n=1 Tax=Tetracentron sinense TaxID=13715 RepID=A0A835DRT2_TETSI|nr:hypothetical protein HHK36_002654 [Tetracentron sinense]
MATVSPVAISVAPAIHQLPNDHSRRPPFLNPILPNCKQNVANLQRLCSQGRLQEISKPLLQLRNDKLSNIPLNIFAYNKLLSSYTKQGRLEDAQQLFDNMPNRDEVSWSTIIAAYTRSGNFWKSFNLLEIMAEEGLRPNEFALGSLLKASSSMREIFVGRQLHGWSIRAGFGLEAGVRTSLITMYSNCGLLSDARRVFDEVPISSLDDVPSWNSIIAAYGLHRCWIETFRLFGDMISTGLVAPTEPTYTSMVNACSSAGAGKYGEIIHGRIIKDGLLDVTNMGNSLITFYGKCGNLEDANKLFNKTYRKNVVSWNAIIAANEQNDEYEIAIGLFCRMLRFGPPVKPNRITFLSVLSAVSGVSALKHGREIHAHIIRSGLELDTSIANSLITMYSKCKEVSKARIVFERLPFKDVVTWNSMLSGYEKNEQQEYCFELFRKMQLSGCEPDAYSFTVILGAASSDSSGFEYFRGGGEIHGYVLRRTAPGGLGVSISNAIITMYAKFNRVADAEKIFKGLKKKDSYSWNAMMDGYSVNDQPEDAIMIFLDVQKEGLPSDHLAFSILLTACGRLVSLRLGMQFHAIIIKHFHHRNYASRNSLLSINNALVSMYSKCGSIHNSAKVFLSMGRRDVFSWTAMITGYSHHGMAYESLQLFERMKRDGLEPNLVTFLGLLTACAHGGLVKEGTHYFSSMSKDYGLNPNTEHYASMVDLFGRSGQLECATKLVEAGATRFKFNHGDTLNLWRVLLGACHAHKQLDLGVHAATKILESEPEDETTHVLLSNLYASSGMWEDAMRVRKLMRDKGLKKEVGCSWIEAGNRRHVFVAGDISHPWRKEIYEKLEVLDSRFRRMGYVPMTEYVLHDVDEMQKEVIIGCHSEKLAVSFGLLQSGSGSRDTIRVIKNLRVCGDCHNWMKITSEMEGRCIVLRDSRRFHFFKDGSCSCGDYWAPSPKPPNCVWSAVADFILPQSLGWNFQRLSQVFPMEVVGHVSRIALSQSRAPDRLVWHFEKNGVYSVRFGYNLLRVLSLSGKVTRPSSSQSVISKVGWKAVWGLDIARKIA